MHSVPDIVADHLDQYCMEFCTEWIWHSPDAEKYRIVRGVCYHEQDFIDYLNAFKFPEEQSARIKNLGWTGLGTDLPAEYASLPYFNF